MDWYKIIIEDIYGSIEIPAKANARISFEPVKSSDITKKDEPTMKKYNIELLEANSVPRVIVVENGEVPYATWYGDHAIIQHAGGVIYVATIAITAIVISAIEEGGNKNEPS